MYVSNSSLPVCPTFLTPLSIHKSLLSALKELIGSPCGIICLKQWKQCQTLFWGAPKSLQMVTAAMKLKDAYSLEGKLWPILDSILKSRDITLPTKVHLVKAIVFPVVTVGLWRRLSAKELMLLNCVLEKTLESPFPSPGDLPDPGIQSDMT